MASRTPGDEPDPAAELLGRWQAHHGGSPESPADQTAAEDADEPAARPPTETPDDPEPDMFLDATAPGPKHAGPRATPIRRRPASARGGDQTEAGREVVEALGITPPVPAAPAAPAGSTPSQPVRRTPSVPAAARSTDVEFAPRVVLRRVLGYLVLALVPATAVAGYVAYDERTTFTLALCGLLLFLVLVLYAVRAGSTPARLAIHSGQLEVVRGSNREVFDLTSRFTRLEVVGKPGRPGWKVLMARFGRDPLVIDSSMVDPTKFMAALERNRPQSR